MGKLTDTPARGTTHTSSPKATSEQIRMAQLLFDPKSEDHSMMKEKVQKVIELTRCDENIAIVTLHDCDNDVEQAVDKLLEGEQHPEEWIVQEGKKTKKTSQQPQFVDGVTNSEDFEHVGKQTVRRGRGGNRGGGFDGPKSRGRGGFSGNRREVAKENEPRIDDHGERVGFPRGRGGRGREDRGGRGRGFGERGGRRGGGGHFNQNESGGFGQIENWNSANPDGNTWDNSMAINNGGGPAGEWGKRRSAAESNTWDNSMARAQANNIDYDWGGEEEWSKVRDGLVIESSITHKQPEIAPTSVNAAPTAAQIVASSHVPPTPESPRVRGESIDVKSLFASNQTPTQPPDSSASAWSASKQATVDLKNELGIGKVASNVIGDATSHAQNTVRAKANPVKVELPSSRAAPIGPIDVQFGDMTLGSDTTPGLFDFNPTAAFQQEPPGQPILQKIEQPLRQAPTPQQHQQQVQNAVFQRPAGGDNLSNGTNLLNTQQSSNSMGRSDISSSTYPVSGATAFTMDQQKISQQLPPSKPSSQPIQQQSYTSSRAPQNIPAAMELPPRHEQHRTGNIGQIHNQPVSIADSILNAQYQRDEQHLLSQTMAPSINAAAMTQVTSKNQIPSTAAPTVTPYQQAMTSMFPYMPYDQNGYLTQNFLLAAAANGFDFRTPLGGANADLKTHLLRQENGNTVQAGPATANVGNLNVPPPAAPPGLPAPTVSNAEQAQALMNIPFYGQLSGGLPFLGASPYGMQPQFFVPTVSGAASAANAGTQYQRNAGYQQAPGLFNSYEELQLAASQQDYGKTNYGVLTQPTTQGKPVQSGGNGGSNVGIGGNDMGNKFNQGMKIPYDSAKQSGNFAAVTGTPPSYNSVGYTPTAGNPTQYGYGYLPPMLNMMPQATGMPSNAQMPNDVLNQRSVNQNGKPVGSANMAKAMNQQGYYGWGNN